MTRHAPASRSTVTARLAAAALAACLGAPWQPAQARMLAPVGPTWPIAEPDMLAWIAERLRAKERSGEIARAQRQARERAVAAITDPPPVPGIGPALGPRTHYVDPTVTLDANVVDDQGRVLYAAGTRANPLAVVSLSNHLLFLDARDRRQVRLAGELIERYDGRVKPILVAGSYLDLMRQWKRRVYYDQHGTLVARLGITRVPAIVSQEGLRLRVDEIALEGAR